MCTNRELKPTYFKEWQYYNPVVEKYFLLKDSMIEESGRRFRIEFALDVSAQEEQNRAIREHHDLEKLVNEALRIALQASSPDESINILLEYLGKALNGDRTYIFERNEEGGDDNTYEWTASGVTPEKDNLQDLPPTSAQAGIGCSGKTSISLLISWKISRKKSQCSTRY